jgi:hypothetical protein
MRLIPTNPERLNSSTVVLVPVKSFAAAKGRLAAVLTEGQRVALMQNLTARVIAAAPPFDVAVVCDDEEVATWSRNHGARVIWTPTRGLNGAVRDGLDALAALGYETVIVAHGDLGSPAGLSQLTREADLVLVPDTRHDGTNVLVISATAEFTFAYGARSFAAHLEEAKRRGLSVQVITDSALQHDVDEPGDLEGLDLDTLLN